MTFLNQDLIDAPQYKQVDAISIDSHVEARLKIHIYHLGAQHTAKRCISNCSTCQTNQYNYLLFSRRVLSFPNNNHNVFLHACNVPAKRSMTTQRLGNEERLCPCKQIRTCYFLLLQDQIFGARCSQFPRGSLGGVVFVRLVFSLR